MKTIQKLQERRGSISVSYPFFLLESLVALLIFIGICIMKKKFLLLFPGCLCLVIIARAQDFDPGQQAQGYLDSKNITVDYSTGIFHYKIPLFTLGTGDFQLPVTMDYTAKGVKREDTPGLFVLSWKS